MALVSLANFKHRYLKGAYGSWKPQKQSANEWKVAAEPRWTDVVDWLWHLKSLTYTLFAADEGLCQMSILHLSMWRASSWGPQNAS